ncbi:MAG TPA: DUF1800 family protein, partial [Anaerolineales bacterium]|nr:DUF1800 family protein [Anaerolineales bacterium]
MTISRRDFLKASGLMAAWTALAACTPTAPGTPHHEEVPTQTTLPQPVLDPTQIITASPSLVPDSEKLLIHTLRRMTFGPTPEMFDKARRLGLDGFIEEQLSPDSIPDSEIDLLLQPYSTLNMTVAQRLQLSENNQSA